MHLRNASNGARKPLGTPENLGCCLPVPGLGQIYRSASVRPHALHSFGTQKSHPVREHLPFSVQRCLRRKPVPVSARTRIATAGKVSQMTKAAKGLRVFRAVPLINSQV